MKGVIMKWKLAILSLLASVSTYANANACGDVTIADMNWNSAGLNARIDQFILKHGYGCQADVTPGDTMATIASMTAKGEPDIAPEMWTTTAKAAISGGLKSGQLVKAGYPLSDGGEEAFWVPEYMVKKYPELKTIAGIKKHRELFKNPEDPNTSAFYGCPAGWGCQITTTNLFKALKLKQAGFSYVDPGSGAGQSGIIAKAYERKEAWFGYYWAPTAILGKYKMVKVDFGTGVDDKEYNNCITKDGCENPKPTMFPKTEVDTIVSKDFAKSHPEIMKYLGKRSMSNADMNKILAWMDKEQADPEDAMYYFFENYPQLWKSWLPAPVAKKVAAAL
jgi:glycine betaine/proline transport system substrate-binding protein